MREIERRLAKLERCNPAGAFYAFAEAGETSEQAITRQFPDGLAAAATAIVFRWAEALRDEGGR